MDTTTSRKPWSELTVLLLVGMAVLIAAWVTDAFDSPAAWTLIAVLTVGYALSRGTARNEWRTPQERPVRIRATLPDDGQPTAPTERIVEETDAEVVVSEEQLEVDKIRRPHERVRLYKEVVTEDVTITVPIRREVVRVERVPIEPGDDFAATGIAELSSGQSDELVLMEERAVVDKRIVPRERVWLEKDVITEEQHFTETVRREQVDVDRERSSEPEQEQITP